MRKGWRIAAACIVLGLAAREAAAQPQAITAHLGSGGRKMSREDCALKAMHFLIKTEKCVKAEITTDGNVRGWTEKAAVAVVCSSFRDGARFSVVAAGYDNAESERLRSAVRQHLTDGGDHDPSTPKTYAAPEADRKPLDLQLRWGIDTRPMTKILRFLPPAISIVMEKQGLIPIDQSNGAGLLIFGGSPDRVATVVAMPGTNETNFQLCAFGISANPDAADRLQRVVRQETLKVLFE